MMKVLFGVDGSERSLAAVRFVSRMLSPHHDRVAFYFGRPQTRFRGLNSAESETQTRAIAALALNVFENARQQLPEDMRERAETITGEGKPSRAIIEQAQLHDCQLIAVAAQNASSRLTFFVGGVARAVANLSAIPVLLYREARKRPQSGPLRVLYAVDNDAAVEHVVTTLNRFHWPAESQALMVHVMDYAEAERLNEWMRDSESSSAKAWSKAYSEEVDRQRAESLAELHSVRDRLPPIFHDHQPIVAPGHVVEQVLATIDAESIDLVVVGSPKPGAIARILGSTSDGLIQRAPCSILIVHPEKAPSD